MPYACPMAFPRAWRNFKRKQDLTVASACLIQVAGIGILAPQAILVRSRVRRPAARDRIEEREG